MVNTQAFSDCFLSTVPAQTVSFRSGLTVYVESLTNGQYVGRQWNAQGQVPPLDFSPDTHPTPQAFWLEIDGQLLNSHWEWIGLLQERDGEKLHVKIRLKHGVRPVEVCVHTLLDGTGIICRWLDITNTGTQSAALSAAYPWSGVLNTGWQWHVVRPANDAPIYSLGYMQDCNWGDEGNFQWTTLPRAGYSVTGRYISDRHRHPMFVIKNEMTGDHFIGQLAWSGGYRFDFELSGERHANVSDTKLFFKAGPDAPAPMRMIEPGETIATPEMSLGLIAGDFDETVQAMHDHIRTTYLPPQPRGRGCWVETGIGPEFELTPEIVHHVIDIAGQTGAEIFWIDASWYSDPNTNWWETVGDWNVGSRFPNGLAEFRDHAHKCGMLWGLWMECERLGSTSQALKDHPDWNQIGYNGAGMPLLDLTRPEISKWMEDQICRVIDEHQLEFFRIDHNAAMGTGGIRMNGGFVENTYWRYYEAFYAIFDRIREKYPNVVLENCAGGGGRTDLGTMKRFSHTWVTDMQSAPRSFSIGNGMTIALPPELVDRHVVGVGQQTFTAGDIDFQARLTLFGKPTVGSMLWQMGAQPSPLVLEKIKHVVGIYKNFVRDFMPTSRFYHHTPTINGRTPQGIGIMEMASKDRTKAIAGIFRLEGQDSDCVLRFKGLDISKRYKVTSDNNLSSCIMDGKELVYTGLPIHLGSPMMSEVILCEEA